MPLFLSATAHQGAICRPSPATLGWLWGRLRHGFPHALACCLQPGRVDLALHGSADPQRSRRRLANVLAAGTRHWGGHRSWRPLAPAQLLPAGSPAARSRLHTLLGLHQPEAILWPWSTLRDTLGLVAQPWVDHSRMRQQIPRFPRPATVQVPQTPQPRRLLAACLAATRQPASAIQRRGPTRRLFIGLAARHGLAPGGIARLTAVSLASVRRNAQACPGPWLASAERCLVQPVQGPMWAPPPYWGKGGGISPGWASPSSNIKKYSTA